MRTKDHAKGREKQLRSRNESIKRQQSIVTTDPKTGHKKMNENISCSPGS